ncbi:MAG: hypothetical protein AAFR02_10695 [Pseudomonadota bacterium]
MTPSTGHRVRQIIFSEDWSFPEHFQRSRANGQPSNHVAFVWLNDDDEIVGLRATIWSGHRHRTITTNAKDVFVDLLGQPHNSEKRVLTNNYGDRFDEWTHTWQRGDIAVLLQPYVVLNGMNGYDFSQGWFAITHEDAIKTRESYLKTP